MSDKKTLIVVESPTKARTLARFLGSAYRIEASMGHIRDLPEKKLGIDVKNHFEPTYEVSAKKRDTVARIKSAAKSAEKVILATDPDREGEAIAWHIHYLLTKAKKKIERIEEKNISRIVFHEITKSAIEHALKSPHGVDEHLVDAQQGRRILDRLVGYKLSPLLWYKTGKNWLSAGRVQSICVRLIVEREREIKAFVPVEYWELSAELKKAAQNSFIAKLVKIQDKAAEIADNNTADKVVADLKNAAYTVSSVEKTEVKKHPVPPFITSTLQRAASTSFGWSARKTMTIAQNLYEEGVITYHRTDSVQLSKESVDMARAYIETTYGKHYIPESPNVYKTTSKVAQEAHEAIRPTKLGDGVIAHETGRDHQKLLDLITKRFLASQMTDQVSERTTVEVLANGTYLFRFSGEKEQFAGWKVLYDKKEAELFLPDVAVGDVLDLIKLIPEQKFTQPPSRFNEASLIKALEQQGIGRPSTYAPTIHTIQLRQYVEKNESRAFVPTELGFMVNDFLVEHFSDVINIAFTAQMEDKLDDVANGKIKWIQVIEDFWKPFDASILKTRSTVQKVVTPVKLTGEKCPQCGGDIAEKVGRYGKFLACTNFPTCKFTKPIVIALNIKCPQCKTGDVVMKKTKKGRKFFGCSTYPTCTFASWQKPGEKETAGSKE